MKKNNKLQIYGLQAIAVVAIILYHAQITIYSEPLFKGGFIGVDIFFVISGYLITSIILKELIMTDSFSFKDFYEKQIRQVFPVLLLIIFASLPFAWFYLLPTDLINFFKSIITVLSFSSNFYFYYSGNAFGELGSLSKPFIHTWLISVLAQYYMLFPIILLIIFRYFRKYLIQVLILGFFISLGLADWGSKNYPSFNFYVLPTRVWELLAGSILAYFEITNGHRSKNKKLNLILPSVGLLLIGHSLLFFNDEMFYPSFYTLSPIIGVCLIIWFSNKNELITKMLSKKLFVRIGLISYSLYLWHYPFFSFLRINYFDLNNSFNLFISILIIFILSFFSYKFIERPARNSKLQFNKLLSIILLTIIIIVIFCSHIINQKGIPSRFPKYINDSLQKSGDLISKEYNVNIDNDNIHFSNDKNKKNIFLLGDSYARSLAYNLYKKIDKEKYNFSTSIFAGCNFILNTNRVSKDTFENKFNCTSDLQNKRLNFINSRENSIVILFGHLPLILEEDRYNNNGFGTFVGKMNDFIQNDKNSLITQTQRQEYIKLKYNLTIKKLLANKHKVILVYPMPEVGANVPELLFQNYKFKKHSKFFKDKKYLTHSYDKYRTRARNSFILLDEIDDESGENIFRVYPDKIFCNTLYKKRCLTHNENSIFYRDDDHPSLSGAELISEKILDIITKIN